MFRIERQKAWARDLMLQTHAVRLACKHPDTPWFAKAAAVCVVAYALSPIDLIPDFIPVLGHLDDLILVPLGISVVLWLVPRPVMEECRRRAHDRIEAGGRLGWAATAVVLLVWVAVAIGCGWLVWSSFVHDQAPE